MSDSRQLPHRGGPALLGAPVAAIGNKNNISPFFKRGETRGADEFNRQIESADLIGDYVCNVPAAKHRNYQAG